MANNEILENAVLELRRGVITMAVLRLLREERYGYALLKSLNGLGLELDQGTLYPLLRRLEVQKLLESDWRIEDSRPRRYYRISRGGREILTKLEAEWLDLVAMMDRTKEE